MLIPIAIKIAMYAIFQCNNSMFKQVLHININTFFFSFCYSLFWFLIFILLNSWNYNCSSMLIFFIIIIFSVLVNAVVLTMPIFNIVIFITTLKNHCYYFIRFSCLFSALSPDLRTSNWWNCLYSLVKDHYQRYIKNPNKSLSWSFLQKQQTAV